jgi:hypothetical protein
MRTLARFAGYAAVVGGVSMTLIHGAFWLGSPDPSFKVEGRVAPLSPRIAASIERKKDVIPRVQPVAEQLAKPMMEANVALTPSPPPKPILRGAQARRQTIKYVSNSRNVAPREITPEAPAVAPRAAVTTARSDVPF